MEMLSFLLISHGEMHVKKNDLCSEILVYYQIIKKQDYTCLAPSC